MLSVQVKLEANILQISSISLVAILCCHKKTPPHLLIVMEIKFIEGCNIFCCSQEMLMAVLHAFITFNLTTDFMATIKVEAFFAFINHFSIKYY